MRPPSPASAARWTAAALVLALVAVAGADWLQPDPSYREQQMLLRLAARDTTGHGDDPGRLDSLGTVQLKLAHLEDAEKLFRRSLAIRPDDATASAALGKLALFGDRLSEAETLLARAANDDPDALPDLFAARVRSGKYTEAAGMARDVGQEGFAPLLERMAESPIYVIEPGRDQVSIPWADAYPVPLVRVRLNGQSVLMGIDTGIGDLILDESTSRVCKVERVPGQRLEFWCGSRIAVKNAMVQRLEIGGIRIDRIPAGIVSLRRWSLDVHRHEEPVAGIIGLNLLRRFTSTLDYEKQHLELRPLDAAITPGPDASRVPFQIWGLNELTVFGSLAGGRKMALVVQTGVPGCGVGAPSEVFDEIGVKPGVLSRVAKGAGAFLQGRPWSGVTVPTVSVGGVVKDKVPGWLGALDESELWRHQVRRDALLASEFFRGHRVTFDWRAREMVIE
jgi:tetratricopeptide repeat protein/aspartyl protease